MTVCLTILAALGCALTGGVFFAFSSFVMRALGRIAPAAGLAAMQSINVVVVNPGFMLTFLGSGVACGLLSFSTWRASAGALSSAGLCRHAAALLYLLGSIGVTMLFNVPRNEHLAGLTSPGAAAEADWARYVVEWTTYNHLRAAASLLAALLLMTSLVLRGGPPPGAAP